MKRLLLLIVFFKLTFCIAQGQIYQLEGSNNFVSAIKSENFRYYAAKRQQKDMWCWAACIEMVLNYQGLSFADTEEEQCSIVKKAFATQYCDNRPGSCLDIQHGADGWVINGRSIRCSITNSANGNELIDQLANKYPVIIGLNMPPARVGHAYVLTAIYFHERTDGVKEPYMVTLRDPSPYAAENNKVQLTWADFRSRINCIAYVTF